MRLTVAQATLDLADRPQGRLCRSRGGAARLSRDRSREGSALAALALRKPSRDDAWEPHSRAPRSACVALHTTESGAT